MKLFPTQEIGSLKKPSWYTAVKNGRRPRSDEVQELRAWARRLNLDASDALRLLEKKPNRKAAREALRWATLFAIRLQEAAGLDRVWDGELWRGEMYESTVGGLPGMRFASAYRSFLCFDENYYKPAECVGPVKPANPYSVEEFRFVRANTSREVKVPVVDAHTVATWSYNVFYLRRWAQRVDDPRKARYEAKRELMLELARGPVRQAIREFVEAGARLIQLDGPAAITDVREFDREELRRLGHDLPLYVEAFNEATRSIGCEFHVHICFPPDYGYELLFPYILEMKNCRQLSLEFANRDTPKPGLSPDRRRGYGVLKTFREYNDDKRLGVGVIDIHTDAVESPRTVRDRILYAAQVLGDPDAVVVTTDCGLRTRSWEVAFRKLRSEVKGAEMARAQFQ